MDEISACGVCETRSRDGSAVAPILVLGLGNEILKDDAIGIRVAEKLEGCFPDGVEIRATSLFGLSLLDELIGREKVLIVDSYLPEDSATAEFREITLDSLGRASAPCPHFVGLAEIREVMRSLDLDFPRTVHVLGIPVTDPLTFSNEMSAEVAARLDEAVQRSRAVVERWL
ncbi:MAG TPA: hydrogenase maturation protease [Terriglobia bacterium]|nr:hydrogenase maturation protease [Terriglobia bacterium]